MKHVLLRAQVMIEHDGQPYELEVTGADGTKHRVQPGLGDVVGDAEALAKRIVRYIRVDTESLGHDWDASEWEVAEQSAIRTLRAVTTPNTHPLENLYPHWTGSCQTTSGSKEVLEDSQPSNHEAVNRAVVGEDSRPRVKPVLMRPKGENKMDERITKLLAARVPAHTLPGIEKYVHERRPPGGFLRAVLENDLKEAFQRADADNLEHLFDIVNYVYNCTPLTCWGSPAAVEAWLEGKS